MENLSTSHSLTVSIVIPAYNEEKGIAQTIETALKQDYPPLEVIVVDNNSSDNTSDVAKQHGAKVILEKKKGVAAARQAGFTHAKGDIIISTDADSRLPKDYVSKIITFFSKHENIIAVGGVARLYSGPWTAKFVYRYISYPFFYLDRILSGGWNMSGFSMAIKKDAFLKTPGFNTDHMIGEDVDISQKLRKIGKVTVEPTLIVYVSGRRYKDGYFKGMFDYAPHFLTRVLLRKTSVNTFEDIRE